MTPRDAPGGGARWWIGLLIVAGCAFGVRAWHVVSLLDSPLGGLLILDSRQYHLEALRIAGLSAAEPALDPSGPSFMNVGYPYLLAGIYALFGASVSAVPWVQTLLGSGTAVVLALAARRLLGGEGVAILAGLLYAFYAPAVFYDGLLLTPTAINAVLSVVLWLVVVAHPARRGWWPALAAGVGIGVAGLLRPSNLLLLPALVPPLLLAARGMRMRHPWRAAAAPALGAALVILPVVLHGGIVHGQWVPVSANGGMNFWVGNNEEARGLYYPAPFLDNQDLLAEQLLYLAEARRRSGDATLTLAGSSAYWLDETLRAIADDPSRWLRLELDKLALFWNRAEAKTNVSMGIVARFSPALARATIGFGVLALAGLAGLVHLLLDGRTRAALLLACWIAVPLSTCLLFFVSGEYRHPASLALCVSAAALVAGLARALLGLRARPLGFAPLRASAGALVAALLVALLVWRDAPAIAWGSHPHADYWNYSRVLLAAEAPDRTAIERKHRLVARLLDPAITGSDSSPALDEARFHARFRAAVELQDADAAARALDGARRFLARDPRLAATDNFAAYLRRSIPQRISELARQPFVAADPQLAREASLMGGNGYREVAGMLARGDREAARDFLAAALERSPHDVILQAELGRLLLVLGEVDDGLAWLERSCDGWPAIPECAFYAADFFARRGDRARAEDALSEALRRRPGFAPALELRERLARVP